MKTEYLLITFGILSIILGVIYGIYGPSEPVSFETKGWQEGCKKVCEEKGADAYQYEQETKACICLYE